MLKTLLLPQLNHIFASHLNPSNSQLKEFFSHLLWEIVILELRRMYLQNYNKGGLKMVSIKKFIKIYVNEKNAIQNDYLLSMLNLDIWGSIYHRNNQIYQ